MTKQAEKAKEKRLEEKRQQIEKAEKQWARGMLSLNELIIYTIDVITRERNIDAKRQLINDYLTFSFTERG